MRQGMTLFILAGIFLGGVLNAEALNVSMTVDAPRVSIQQGAVLTLSVEDGDMDATILPPESADFRLQAAGTSTQTTIINFKASKLVRYTYRLTPLKTGRLTIPPFRVQSGGKTAATEPLFLEVLSRDEAAAAAPDSLDAAIWVDLLVEPETVWVDQSLSLTFRLFERSGVPVRDREYQAPDLSQFLSPDKPQQRQTRQQIDGVLYDVIEVEYRVFPTRSGSWTLGPAAITVHVAALADNSRTRRRSLDAFFDDPFFGFGRTRTVPVQRITAPVTLTVMPLPAEGRPEHYTGIVGEYHMEVTTSPLQNLKAGDAVTLTITIEGRGHIQNIGEPMVEPGTAFRLFDPEVQTETDPMDPLRGRKTFKRILIPESAGDHRLPAVHFHYFNPLLGEYLTETWEGPQVSVTEDTQGSDMETMLLVPAPDRAAAAPRPIEMKGHDIIFLDTSPDILRPMKEPLPRNVFGIYLLMAPLGCGWIIFRERRRARWSADSALALRHGAYRNWKKRVASLKHRAGPQGVAIHEQLHAALAEYLGHRFQVPLSLTGAEVATRFEGKGVPGEILKPLAQQLETLELARFGGGSPSPEALRPLMARICDLVDSLEKVK